MVSYIPREKGEEGGFWRETFFFFEKQCGKKKNKVVIYMASLSLKFFFWRWGGGEPRKERL